MPPFNILFVFPLPCHPERGGVERVTDVLTKEFIRRGHKVFYLHKKGSMADYGKYTPPAQVAFLPQRKLKAKENIKFYHCFLKTNKIDFIINQMGVSRNYCPFTDVEKNESGFPRSISVVHTAPLLNYHYLFSGLLHPKKKSPIAILRNVLNFLTFPLYKRNFLQKRKREITAVANSSDCLCLLSEGYRSDMELIGLHPQAPCLIRSIANPCSLTPDAPPTLKKKQILFVGRLEPHLKAPQRLIPIWEQLCHRHPDWELVIVGDGPSRKSLEKKASSLPRIRFEGIQSPVSYYRDAAICCLTSSVEGFGMVLLESMAFGCVPFAYNTFPTLGDIFATEAELLSITPFNSTTYAEHLSFVMQNEEKRKQLAELSLQKSRKYTVQTIANRWETLFEELAAK